MGHGRMSYQLKTARLIMIFINVIFFLIGATLFGQGIELLTTRRFPHLTDFLSIIENSTITKNRFVSDEILYIILIVSGLIFVFIGFFGCSGAITQIQCLLFLYSSIIGIILIFQTIIIITLIIFPSKFKRESISTIRLFIHNKYKGPLEKNLQSISLLWDLIMYHFKCCGIENKNDFNITKKWNRTNPWWNNSMSIEYKNFKYPLTCCPINENFTKDQIEFHKVISCAINGSDIYEIGCYKKLADIFHSVKGDLLIIISFIIIIEMFALIFVLIIYHRNQKKRILYGMEGLPPAYSPRTRINNSNIYFQI